MDTATSWMGRLKTAWSISSFGERQGHILTRLPIVLRGNKVRTVYRYYTVTQCVVILLSSYALATHQLTFPHSESFLYVYTIIHMSSKRYSYHLSTHTADIWGVVVVHNKTKQKTHFFGRACQWFEYWWSFWSILGLLLGCYVIIFKLKAVVSLYILIFGFLKKRQEIREKKLVICIFCWLELYFF